LDEETAAKCLSNTANAMKMLHMLPGNAKKGMEYYRTARDILGNLPEIEEGIEVYTRLGELKKPGRGFLEIIGGLN
jgi:hypothetical protein